MTLSKKVVQLVLGLEIGGSKVRVTVRRKGVRFKKTCVVVLDSYVELGPEETADQLRLAMIFALRKTRLRKYRIVATTLSCPGPFLDFAKGIVGDSANLGKKWRGKSITKIVQKVLGLQHTPKLANDGTLAGLGEAALRGLLALGKQVLKNSMVYYGVGTGLGGAVLINGHVFEGESHNSAELGHSALAMEALHCTPEGERLMKGIPRQRCGCGRIGCLESYVGVAALAKQTRLRHLIDRKLRAFPVLKNTRAKNVLALAREGHRPSLRLLAAQAWALGIAIACDSFRFDPKLVVIGGGIVEGGPRLLRQYLQIVKRAVKAYGFPPIVRSMSIEFAIGGDDGGVIGAALEAELRVS